jgi:beta-xylosidase
VLTWDFEVWNEANLEVFWSGTKTEWLQLYDVSAAAVKSVDPRLAVGGPSSAAAGWVDDLLDHTKRYGTPIDFVSTHTYGSPPLDVRASLERHGYGDLRILWTEWGVTPTHFNPINDSVFSGVVPAPRDEVRGRPDRRTLVLGRIGPLRRARSSTASAARRIRPCKPLVGWRNRATTR